MKLLVLGGTIFLGRHLVEQALGAGHEITLFTRGRHNADLFPEAERLRGDRDGGLQALAGRRWDAVVDTCGYVPRIVRDSARLLAPSVERYLFVSSISVYRDFARPGVDEDGPLAELADPSVETVDGETYGGLKALCERACAEELPGRALLVRPGLIVGPYDPTDRFTYWPERFARGGEAIAPGSPDRVTQVIDVRDLAAWMLRMVEAGRAGVYNATGPEPPLTFGRLFEACRQAGGAGTVPIWVDEAFLQERGVAPWSELPLWVPQTPDQAGFDAVAVGRAIAEGLRFRPIDETVRDTLAWAQTLPADRPRRAGLAPEKEAEVLRAWKARG